MSENETYNLENAKAQMRKGVLEFPVLLIVAVGEVYTADILKKLKEADLVVVEGTLYPLLSRLKRFGLVDYRWEESQSGPPRKYYFITDEGRLIVDTLQNSWETLEVSIKKLIKKYEKSN